MAISKEEQLKEAWLAYFKNIQKENELIRLLLKYYKKIETEINKIELANLKKRNDDSFEEGREYSPRKKQEEIKSILPAYTEFVSRKELRQYLLKANTKIDEMKRSKCHERGTLLRTQLLPAADAAESFATQG